MKGKTNMKEKYIKPQTDINTFHTVDVVTTSSGGDDEKRKPIELPDL